MKTTCLLLTLTLLLGAALAAPGLIETTELTNTVTSTNVTDVDAPPAIVPPTQEGFWKGGIGLVTMVIVWAVSKIPNVPRPMLPLVSPFIGMALNYGLTFMSSLNLPWWEAGMAGGLGVTIREIFNQWVTKQMKPLEASKTDAKPVDHAVAVSDKTVAGKAELKETGKNGKD